jgi:hypothetical protein
MLIQCKIALTVVGGIGCASPHISLIPERTSMNTPAQFRRMQDFYISSNIILDCPASSAISVNWTLLSCSVTCSQVIQLNSSNIVTTSTELYIPARSLDFGLYQFQLKITMRISSVYSSTASVFVRINPTGLTVNLVPLGTSVITSGQTANLLLDPATNSFDPDSLIFNASVIWQHEPLIHDTLLI